MRVSEMNADAPAPRRKPVRRKVILIAGVVLLSVAYLALRQPGIALVSKSPKSELELRKGLLYRVGGQQPYSGMMIEYYTNHVLKSRSWILEGRLDGISIGWYPDGQLEIQEQFKAGVSDGLRMKWYPNGVKMSEANIKSGKLDGIFKQWHENGSPAAIVEMRGGNPSGHSVAYYPDGFLKTKALVENGKVLTQKFWKDGELKDSAAAEID